MKSFFVLLVFAFVNQNNADFDRTKDLTDGLAKYSNAEHGETGTSDSVNFRVRDTFCPYLF